MGVIHSSREADVVLGPLATAGFVSLGWAAAKRSRTALTVGIVALMLEARWTAYRRLTRDRRFQTLNLVMVFREAGLDEEAAADSESV